MLCRLQTHRPQVPVADTGRKGQSAMVKRMELLRATPSQEVCVYTDGLFAPAGREGSESSSEAEGKGREAEVTSWTEEACSVCLLTRYVLSLPDSVSTIRSAHSRTLGQHQPFGPLTPFFQLTIRPQTLSPVGRHTQ